MAMTRHPITGVALNEIAIERTALTYEEAVTAWVLRMTGEKFAIVAQMLGTNTHRIGEVFRGEKHPGARDTAEALLNKF